MRSEDEDMTQKLGDDLLLHILSFLPTKDALRTSVLSTRWRHLWASFSNIDLEDLILYYPSCRTSFLHFVDRLVHGHDDSDLGNLDSDITRFKVSCDVHVDDVRICSWICAVINHNVEEILLHFPLIESCILPTCLFSSRSLTILSISFYGGLGFPSSLSVKGPCLKSLNLSEVEFLSDNSTNRFFSELSSILPTLQQLSLVHCGWKNISDLVIVSLSLVSLTIDIKDDDLLECDVVVVAPKLSDFHCQTDGSISTCLAYATSLADASLCFTYPGDNKPIVAYERLKILLGGLRNSKSLNVSTLTISALSLFFEDLPVFESLTYLDISGFMAEMTVEDILESMEKTPNLEYLSISLDVNYDDTDNCWSIDPIPGCPMHKLKKLKIKVSGLATATAEIHLVKFFLENACNLEEIKVCAHMKNAEKLARVGDELVALPRSSEKCMFVFEVLPRRNLYPESW